MFKILITYICLKYVYKMQHLEGKVTPVLYIGRMILNFLNAELNPICHLLTLLGARHILHVSRTRVKG
jgi:hypothetical protein